LVYLVHWLIERYLGRDLARDMKLAAMEKKGG
jgi:hypothetical protein